MNYMYFIIFKIYWWTPLAWFKHSILQDHCVLKAENNNLNLHATSEILYQIF